MSYKHLYHYSGSKMVIDIFRNYGLNSRAAVLVLLALLYLKVTFKCFAAYKRRKGNV